MSDRFLKAGLSIFGLVKAVLTPDTLTPARSIKGEGASGPILPRMAFMGLKSRSRIVSRQVHPTVDRDSLRASVARFPDGILLESVAGQGGRFSIIGLEPVRKISIPGNSDSDPFGAIGKMLASGPNIEPNPEIPFSGGWIGFLSYEAGRFTEPTAHWRVMAGQVPLAHWMLFDTLLVHDRQNSSWTVVATEWDDPSLNPIRAMNRCEWMAQWCERLPNQAPESMPPSKPLPPPSWNMDRFVHTAGVRRVLDYLRAGDVFQVNLARQARCRVSGSPMDLYRRLCQSNPADYAAYIPFGSKSAVISSSPELFLELRDGVVRTRPIKGTRPRTGDTDLDAAAVTDLSSSAKDAAELNMIVDLLRNDLGRVCEYGTVRVDEMGAIETHPTVFHRVAEISGRMRGDADVADLMRATFPGGSVTGAPKVRAMQIINQLEPDPRGAYCGAIGFLGLDGSVVLNLAIRTMTVHDGHVTLAAGGGIVIDSDPDAEFDETEAKARGMIAALEVEPWAREPRASARAVTD